ncbi:MAG: PepSY-like domain-containing protein [Chitinophagaceae bacterium]|nr:PepSY-like domain-containing protein [Chitinophagaceae bacterium]
MQVKNWMLATAVVAVLASCGEAGSKNDDSDTTLAGTTNSTSTETQTTKRTVVVPEATRTSFAAKYPQAADVSWSYHYDTDNMPIDWELAGWPTLDTSYYVATFDQGSDDYWVWYDDNGDWFATVTEVSDHASLPAAVNKTVKSQFAGYTIVSIDKENDKNRTAYEIQMENGEDKMKALIAENGQVLKKKGKVDGEKVKEKSNVKDTAK